MYVCMYLCVYVCMMRVIIIILAAEARVICIRARNLRYVCMHVSLCVCMHDESYHHHFSGRGPSDLYQSAQPPVSLYTQIIRGDLLHADYM